MVQRLSLCRSDQRTEGCRKEKRRCSYRYERSRAAAISIARLLLTAGFKDITLCDRKGAIYEGPPEGMNPIKEEWLKLLTWLKNPVLLQRCWLALMYLSVFQHRVLLQQMVKTMNKDAVVFACANPTPEIFPDDAKAGGAKVVSTEEVISRIRSTTYLLSGNLPWCI